ncbi:MAG: transglycosylase SLT domain-containing protein [Gammaproteobacteria bacterium]
MDEQTRLKIMPQPPGGAIQPLQIRYPAEDGERSAQFARAFQVGRDKACQVRVDGPSVSRRHLECFLHHGHWWVRDLKSSNGTFRDGERLEAEPISRQMALALGRAGPVIHLDNPNIPLPASTPAAEDVPDSTAAITRRYLDPDYSGEVGDHTAKVRQAVLIRARKQARRHWGLLALALLLLAGVAGVAIYQHLKVEKISHLAIDIFYTMKTLELQVTKTQLDIYDTRTAIQAQRRADLIAKQQQLETDLAAKLKHLDELQRQYAEFVAQLQSARLRVNSEDALIWKIARAFGECDAAAPDDFAAEVKRYIVKWRATDRLAQAIRRLNDNAYTATIVNALKAQGLPPQFLYLALQESNFRADAVGPATRFGNAKGMWQFIPSTAMRYGLRLGTQAQSAVYDPSDERHDFAKATEAAARYLSDIYRTDAQASGLLVMASYNWGEGNIIRLIQQLPENPRERNFWALLQSHDIPQETYDYVFYIFAAAVIGEDPQRFGFDFANPLAGYE